MGPVLVYTQWISRLSIADAVKDELRQVAIALGSEVCLFLKKEIEKVPIFWESFRIRAFSKEKAYGYGARKPTGIIEPLKRRNEQDPRMTDNSPFVLQIQTADSVRNSSAVP